MGSDPAPIPEEALEKALEALGGPGTAYMDLVEPVARALARTARERDRALAEARVALRGILDHPGHTTSDEYPTLGENPSDKERAEQAWRIIEDMRVMASTALDRLPHLNRPRRSGGGPS